MRKLTGKQSELEDELSTLRRRIVVVDSYTDGWDIVVGRVMDRVRSLEHRVDDLEYRLNEKEIL